MSRFDYLGDKASNYYLMNLIKEFWRKRGHHVNVWLEKAADPQGTGTVWVLRSNIDQSVSNAMKGYSVG